METEIDKTALARLMLEWEAKRKELDKIETDIKDIVLELGESFTVGDIKGHKRGDWRRLVARVLESSLFMQIGDNDEIR